MTKTYALPPRFYHDHVARALPSGTIVRETKSKVFVDLDREAYDDLLSDADYYSNVSFFEPYLFGLCSSAAATLKILRADPFPDEEPVKAIDRPGVLDALRAIRAEAKRLETGHGYPPVSVRSLHTDLKLETPLVDILEACVDGGFSYCLDHTIEATSYSGGEEHTGRPSRDVCYWGPDQLRSRLDCVDFRIYRGAW